ncbi:GIN domain-containing protein [Rhodophyticola sp. CCM32]|uniref:GIN domain-containing protein n=1 Tax=Rhodophyticola sp. CCM32 TaxID=2916397 RepID=UPI00143DB8FC|nr:DUF2807 domain-containing protein [Rhodophyticola sp. CCM32]
MFERLGAGAIAISLMAGSAMAQDRVFDFEGFTRVDIAEGVIATLHPGPFQVQATARRGNIDRLVIEQDGDVLRVERRAPVIRSVLNSTDRFEVAIHMPELARIVSRAGAVVTSDVPVTDRFEGRALHGASLHIEGAASEETTLSASGGASLQFEGRAGEADILVENGSTMRLAGDCTDLSAEIRAGAHLNAGQMQCHNLDVSARAGADAVLYGDQTAEVNARFGASVRVLGDPRVENSGHSFGGAVRFN